MKFTAKIDLTENRKAIEDLLIECWQKRGVDENFIDVMDTIAVDLIGENALSVDELRRSLEFFPEGPYFALFGGFGRSGKMFGLLEKLHVALSDDALLGVTCNYQRFYDVSVDGRIAKGRSCQLDMRYLEQFPSIAYDLDERKVQFSVGQKGEHLKAWNSIGGAEEFGDKVEEFVRTSDSWKGYEIQKWPVKKGGVATLAMIRLQHALPFDNVKSVIAEAEKLLFINFRGFFEFLSFGSIPEGEFWEICRDIVVRGYEEGSLFAEVILFPGSAIWIYELRARKENVFGTAYEKVGIVLMSSSWKGTKFLAKRVFEDGRYKIRMRLAGKENVCRLLLKEMEEELGVEITIESCK